MYSEHHDNRCLFGKVDSRRNRPETQSFAYSSTGHFKIHYDITGQDAPSQSDSDSNSVPDYVEYVGIIAENSRNTFINDMGYLPEVPDDDGVYDIYIEDRPPDYYGVNYPDECISNCSGIPGASWIIIDNEYEQGEFFTSGLNTMRITVAHEFFHAIQRAYFVHNLTEDDEEDNNFFWEMTATWVEDIMVPNSNDYIEWMNTFFDISNMEDGLISDFDGYGLALFGHYLSIVIDEEEDEIESSIIRKIWEDYSTSTYPSAFASIKNVLENEYNSSFAYAWGDYCSRNHFNGELSSMDSDIYYYPDQIEIDNTFNLTEFTLNANMQTQQLILNNEEAVAFKKYKTHEMIAIDFDFTTVPNNSFYHGFISIKPNNEGLNQIIPINEGSGPFILYPNDNIFLTFTGDQAIMFSYEIDYNTNLPPPQIGDVNLDETINIVDVVLLINYILGYISLNEMQIDAANVSGDVEELLNIIDILLIIGIILDS